MHSILDVCWLLEYNILFLACILNLMCSVYALYMTYFVITSLTYGKRTNKGEDHLVFGDTLQ